MMIRYAAAFCLVLAMMFGAGPDADAVSPVQLSLYNPVQIIPESGSIEGVSLGVLYTVNDNVTGVNFTLIANRLSGDMKGWQAGLVNFVDGEVWGLQEGVYNRVEGNVYGWQSGLVNINGSLTHGFQSGFYNRTDDLKGVQLGFVNMTNTLSGLQIGLLNFNYSGDPHGFLPIVNWSF